MDNYTKKQYDELKKYKGQYPGEQIQAVYDVISQIMKSELKRSEIIMKVAADNGKSADTVRNWLNKYKRGGIIPLLSMESVAMKLIKRDGRPIGDWNKRTLCDYLNKHSPQIGESCINYSQTFCLNLLNKLNNGHRDDMVCKINLLYQKREVNLADFIFVDYFRLPSEKNPLSLNVRYVFIISFNNDFIIKRTTVNKNRQGGPAESSFEKVIMYLKDDISLLTKKSYIILKDDFYNREIMEKFCKKPYKVNILVGDPSELHEDIKQVFNDIEEKKKEINETISKFDGQLPKRLNKASRRKDL